MKEFPTEFNKPPEPQEDTDGSVVSAFGRMSKSRSGKALRASISVGALLTPQTGYAEDTLQEEVITEPTTLQVDARDLQEEGTDELARARMRYVDEKITSVIKDQESKFKNNPEYTFYSDRAEKLKEQQELPEFREGLLFLAEIDADLSQCIKRVDIDRLRDVAWLKQRVSAVPIDVRSKLRMSFTEFDARENIYSPDQYSDPDFKRILEFFAQENVKPSTLLVDIVRKQESQIPKQQLVHAYAHLLSANMSNEDLVFLYLDQVRDPALLKNDRFPTAIITLHSLGIEASTISAAINSENALKITSENYVNSIIKLQNSGLEITRETLHNLPAKELPPEAIENIKSIMSHYPNLQRDVYKIPVNLLAQEELIATIDNLQKNNEIAQDSDGSDIIHALKLTTIHDENGDLELLAMIKNVSEQTSIGFNPFDNLDLINDIRLSDPTYFKHLRAYLEKGREGKSIARSAIDATYINDVLDMDLSVIHDDIHAYSSALQRSDIPPAAIEIITKQKYFVYMSFVRDMSREDSQAHRLQDLNGLDTRTKFDILASVGEHGWTSTQNLIYDGYHIEEDAPERSLTLYESIKREYGDAHTFLMEMNPSDQKLSSFLEILAQMDKVESFFDLMGSDEQKNEVVQKFLLGLEQASDVHSKVSGLIESLRALKWDGVEEIILTGIESEATRLKELIASHTLRSSTLKKAHDAILWYELITASYFKKHPQDDLSPWKQTALEKYGDQLPSLEIIPKDKMFPHGVHIRYHTFFNNWDDQNSLKDKDGHRSFETTLKRFGGTVSFDKDGRLLTAGGGRSDWNITMKTEGADRYVMMTKTDEESGRKMINIMNSPKMTNEQVITFYDHFLENFVDEGTGANGVQGYIMRGHNISSISNTAMKVFDNLVDRGKNDIPYVNFGSCGGYKYGQKILEKSNSSFFFGTQGTGMADVNVNVQMRDMEYSLANGNYDSKKLKELSDKKFVGYSQRMQEGYASYRWPHDNGVTQVFAAFNNIKNK